MLHAWIILLPTSAVLRALGENQAANNCNAIRKNQFPLSMKWLDRQNFTSSSSEVLLVIVSTRGACRSKSLKSYSNTYEITSSSIAW